MNWRVWIHWPKHDLTEWVPVNARDADTARATIEGRYKRHAAASRPRVTRVDPILNAQQWAADDAA